MKKYLLSGLIILMMQCSLLHAQLLNDNALESEYEYGIRDQIADTLSVIRLRITPVYDFNFHKEDQQGRSRELLHHLSSFKNLQSLDISFLDSTFAQSVDSALQKISNLQQLQVFSLSQYKLTSFPVEIFKLGHLRKLTLEINLTELPENFGTLQHLEELRLSVLPVKDFPASFGLLQNLKVLNLDRCYKLEKLPVSVCKLNALEELSVENREIKALPEEFGNLTNLKRLYLILESLAVLPPSFENLKNLEELYLESVVTRLPVSFSNLSDLKIITLYGADTLLLEDSFKKLATMKNLRELNLPYCSRNILPKETGLLKNIESLGLDNWWQLTLNSLPPEISKMEHLKLLHLNGTGIKEEDSVALRKLLPGCQFDFEIRYCFNKGAMITMSDGNQLPVDKIHKGDRIMAINLNSGKLETSEIDSVFIFSKSQFEKIWKPGSDRRASIQDRK